MKIWDSVYVCIIFIALKHVNTFINEKKGVERSKQKNQQINKYADEMSR